MRVLTRTILFACLICILALTFSDERKVAGADHGDAPMLGTVHRNDAKLTDLFAFRDNNQLVIILCADPNIPVGATSYTFQDDVTFEINIDNSTAVSHIDPTANATYGGTVVSPGDIHPDIKFTITFEGGQPRLVAEGLRQNINAISLFAGMRDDPFIRGPRIGRNSAAMVLKMPLPFVVKDQSDLLIWATSRVPQMNVPQADLAGRSLRSMFPENAMMNDMPPNLHSSVMGVPPDVVIYDTRFDAVFPNGRRLTDDVVDMVGDARVVSTDTPFPSSNDVPFLKKFPYLAPPQ